jgi:hypothetical protein
MRYMLMKEEVYVIRDKINNHMTLLIYCIILEKQKQY